jgi:hypothetical protein
LGAGPDLARSEEACNRRNHIGGGYPLPEDCPFGTEARIYAKVSVNGKTWVLRDINGFLSQPLEVGKRTQRKS